MKQDDYRNMCDEIKLSEEQKDKIWVAARAKVQTKKENRQNEWADLRKLQWQRQRLLYFLL